MTPLERELIDVGEHLAHGTGDGLARAVQDRLGATNRSSVTASRPPLWLKVAAGVFVAFLLALAIGPTRRAMARLLGIGAIEIRPVPTTVLAPGAAPSAPSLTVPGRPSTTVVAATSATSAPSGAAPVPGIVDAQRRVTFPILTATDPDWGPARSVDVDDRVPGGLVAIAYDRFTLVELASSADGFPIMAKLAPPDVTVSFATVGSDSAVWVQGAHEIAYRAPDGTIRTDTVRRSGSVLVWTRGAVTYRIEGFDDVDDAVRAATSVR